MNSKERTVSVVIPAYNVKNSLRTCIDSVIQQTLAPYEVLVINDGSTDNTEAVAKSYGDRIKYLEQPNQGQGAARNKGLEVATGEYVAFLDADDYWLETFLEICVAFMEEHRDAVAVSTGLITRLVNGKEIITPKCLHDKNPISSPVILDDFYKFWAEQDHVRTGSNVIRKSIIDIAGYQRPDLRVSQDLEYWGYIATFGKWGFIPQPLWVGNSMAEFATIGLTKKYRRRRKLSPTVESWEKRIVPRLEKYQIQNFETVRGRVAAGYAHNKILAGDGDEAYDIVKKYGPTMPNNRVTWIMRTSIDLGSLTWKFTCFVIKAKDYIKSWKLYIRQKAVAAVENIYNLKR